MKDYKVTIIMSNYNQEDYISKAIDSVLCQKTNFDFQLIITDDNSTKDNSIEIIKSYESKYPEKIKVLYNKENGKYLKNILRAKAITKTPYFCLLDADDYWTDEHFLQRAYDFLEKNNEYVIYYENVNCLLPNNDTKPFIDKKIKSGSYSLGDYFDNKLPIVQTTGQFYRNIIFLKGIPEIINNAVGTFSERSFEGDFDRFIIHLKFGKAYYNNNICGIYRILPNAGIWTKLAPIEQHIIILQSYYDYNRYFEYEYQDFFINKMYQELSAIVENYKDNYLSFSDFCLDDKYVIQLRNLYMYIKDNKKFIQIPRKKFLDYTIKQILKKILRIH